MSTNKDIVTAFYEAGNRGDIDGCLGLIADDIVWVDMGSTRFSGEYRGKEDLVNNLIGPLFGSLKAGITTTIKRLIAEGDLVVAETKGDAETSDGPPYKNDYCQIIRIKDGLIVEVTEYLDTELVTNVFGR
jgi:ketosteroid isomerase-like protein